MSQQGHTRAPRAARSTARGAQQLGRLLVQRGVIGEMQLAVALKAQQRTGRRLGELIVTMRFATAEDVERTLAIQRGARGSRDSGS
jgi:hypothetical protein